MPTLDTVTPTIRVPDLIEPVTGWRTWRIDPRTGVLASVSNGTRWSRDMRAECRHDGGHRAPEPDCQCGLYSFYERESLTGALDPFCAVGVVRCWGDIEAHGDGMRAEYARVVAVAPVVDLHSRAPTRVVPFMTYFMFAGALLPLMALVGLWSAEIAWTISLLGCAVALVPPALLLLGGVFGILRHVLRLRRYCRREGIAWEWRESALESYADAAMPEGLRPTEAPPARSLAWEAMFDPLRAVEQSGGDEAAFRALLAARWSDEDEHEEIIESYRRSCA